MPTLVRIRGKRRRKGDPKPAPSRKVSRKHENIPVQKSDSQLELLPTEILQDIFLECANFALPLSSPLLYSKLTSDHVKVQLALRFLTGASDVAGSTGDGEDSSDLCSDLKNIHLLPTSKTRAQDDPDSTIGAVQTSILQAPWFTYRFLQQCQLDYYVREASKQLGHFLKGLASKQRAEEIKNLRQWLNKYIYRLDASHSTTDPKVWSDRYCYERKDGLVFSCDFTPYYLNGLPYGVGSCLVIVVATRPIPERVPEDMGVYHINGPFIYPSHCRYTCPELRLDTRLPVGLLRKPFTQAQGNLLHVLLNTTSSTTAERRVIPYDEHVLDEALESAIEDNCDAAVDTILGTGSLWGMRYVRSMYDRRGCVVIPDPDGSKRMCIEKRKDATKYLTPIQPDGPWRILTSPPRQCDPALIPRIRYNHLSKALDSAVRTNDEDFHLLRWIMRCGVHENHLDSYEVLQGMMPKSQFCAGGRVDSDSIYEKACEWISNEFRDAF